MPKPFPEVKRLEWKELVHRQEISDPNVSISQWCREQEIRYKPFLYWKKQFGSPTKRPIDHSAFKELTDSLETTGLSIEYRGVRISLSKNFDAETLTRCLQACGGLSC